jgi:hypothetical protein
MVGSVPLTNFEQSTCKTTKGICVRIGVNLQTGLKYFLLDRVQDPGVRNIEPRIIRRGRYQSAFSISLSVAVEQKSTRTEWSTGTGKDRLSVE